jgi:radical SAM superfamily enzyme YgiQ (UPF0313 family)
MEAGDDYLQDGHSFHLGLAYVAAILRQHGLAVSILDCFAEGRLNVRADQDGWREVGLSNDAILRRVRALAPDLIGISIPFSCQHYVAQEVIRLVKTALPETIVVVGGNHVTAVPERIDPSHVDYFVIGEGEYALLRLVQALNAGGPTDGIPGVTPKGAQGCLPPEYIEPLDDLPFPALDLLPLTKIWQGGRRWINMVATRGCVYECNFCSIHTIMGYRIRRRSIDNVVAEIRHWKTQYNIQEVYFEDDNLTTNRKWAKAFFRRLAGERFGIRFYARNGIRADSIDRELLVLMKAAGFHDFMIAPETGSQATLDTIIGKRMRLEDCTRAVDLAREVGLGINAFFVFGFPGETWEDIQTTLRYAQFLKERGCVGFWLSLATPYPGTRLFKQCLEQGVIPADMDYRHFRTVDYLIQNPNYTARELKAFRQRAMQMLAPPRLSLLQKMWKGFTLLRRDPNFFWVKVRYKLGAYL